VGISPLRKLGKFTVCATKGIDSGIKNSKRTALHAKANVR
jgi:hypothetical protein